MYVILFLEAVLSFSLNIYEENELLKERVLRPENREYIWEVSPGKNYTVELTAFDRDGMEIAFGKTKMKAGE